MNQKHVNSFVDSIKGILLSPKTAIQKAALGNANEARKVWLVPLAIILIGYSVSIQLFPNAALGNPFAANPTVLFIINFAGIFIGIHLISFVFSFSANIITKNKQNYEKLLPAVWYTEGTVAFLTMALGIITGPALQLFGGLFLLVFWLLGLIIGLCRVYLLSIAIDTIYRLSLVKMVLVFVIATILLLIIGIIGSLIFGPMVLDIAKISKTSEAPKNVEYKTFSDLSNYDSSLIVYKKINVREKITQVVECGGNNENDLCDSHYEFVNPFNGKKVWIFDGGTCEDLPRTDFRLNVKCNQWGPGGPFSFNGYLRDVSSEYMFHVLGYEDINTGKWTEFPEGGYP